MVKIILTRHGQTLENLEGRFQGHLHGTLSERGILQARKLAERVTDEKIDKIISSDLARAFDTAKEIAKFHKDIPLIKDERIKERNLGEIQGKTKKELGLGPNELVAGKIETLEGETREELFERAKTFVNSLIGEEGTILLVGHNGINLALIANLLGLSFENYTSLPSQKNTAVNLFEIKDKLPAEILLENCTAHLD